MHKWKSLKKEKVFSSKWIIVFREKVLLPDQSIVDDFYTVSGNTLVSIVAVTPDQKIILIKQYRHGVNKILWDIPGGGAETGEPPLGAAKRELMEETGYRAQHWTLLGQFYPDPARSPTTKHIFFASKAIPVKESAEESIQVKLSTVKQIKTLLKQNEIEELTAALALQMALRKLYKQ